ncbi:MAG: CAP domain-containing protein [Lentimicrobiaceae bacterium]|nr:CAP domain-containing protein [Lentimicrobiaceae bacterium]
MNRILILLTFSVLSMALFAQSHPVTSRLPFKCDTLRITHAEEALGQMINSYRQSKNLPPVPFSAALSLVARLHAIDLAENYRPGGRCNLHTWSKSPYWSSCCYTPDHRNAACMWDKPRELTSYTGDGFEIAYYTSDETVPDIVLAEMALKGWKSSRGHHEIIINRGKWHNVDWKAMGIGMYRGYAIIWFGELTDEAGSPRLLH